MLWGGGDCYCPDNSVACILVLLLLNRKFTEWRRRENNARKRKAKMTTETSDETTTVNIVSFSNISSKSWHNNEDWWKIYEIDWDKNNILILWCLQDVTADLQTRANSQILKLKKCIYNYCLRIYTHFIIYIIMIGVLMGFILI